MANKEKMGPPTLEMIQGNPYNYTFDEVAKCMGEERAKSLFKIFCENWQNPVKQRITPHFLTTSPSNYYEFTTKE